MMVNLRTNFEKSRPTRVILIINRVNFSSMAKRGKSFPKPAEQSQTAPVDEALSSCLVCNAIRDVGDTHCFT